MNVQTSLAVINLFYNVVRTKPIYLYVLLRKVFQYILLIFYIWIYSKYLTKYLIIRTENSNFYYFIKWIDVMEILGM